MIQNNIFLTNKNCASFEEAVALLPDEIKEKVIVRMEQVHSNTISEVKDTDISDKPQITLKNTDGCYTTSKKIILSVKTADCLPILLQYKPLNLVAAVHAGRKGTQSNIITNVLMEISQNTNLFISLKESNEQVNIYFAPVICFDCYQIDRKTNTHFDLISENKNQIIEFFENNNISSEKINFEINKDCTLHNNERYYSYRAHGPGVKMNYSFIWNS